ncbi:MAG: MerR family transcriptional regulator, partial [Balneolaceae bacterium]
MKKLYYSIGEVSEITSVEPHVLRYWETIFDELSPRKNKAGNRTYKQEDITVILKL